jgi:uncharacterized membrane protein
MKNDITVPLMMSIILFITSGLPRLGIPNHIVRLLSRCALIASAALLVLLFYKFPVRVEIAEPYGPPIEIILWLIWFIFLFLDLHHPYHPPED